MAHAGPGGVVGAVVVGFASRFVLARTVERRVARAAAVALVVLVLVLAGGLAFANSQLFLAAPVLATLLIQAIARRDRPTLGDLLEKMLLSPEV